MYTGGGGGGRGRDCCVKNSIANSTNETEHRTLTQSREEVFHNTNLEHYKTLRWKKQKFENFGHW